MFKRRLLVEQLHCQCGNLSFAFFIGYLATCLPAHAAITTDGSVGAVQALSGAMRIPQTLGRLAGNNLFHSFRTFNINTGESATFTTTTPTIANVISRVTGGTVSNINGPLSLQAAAGTPAFFFINPAGVTFGAGASIDVPGAFHVSTADYLKFPDGNFYANTTSASTFSTAPPEAFGFLGASRASISVKDVLLANASGSIALVAGDVEISNAGLITGSDDIHIVASGAGATEVSRSGIPPSANGRLEIDNGSAVYSEAGAQSVGGNINIAAGATGIRSGTLVGTFSSNAQPAGSISAELASLEIDGRSASGGTGITSQAAKGELGGGGNVVISARDGIRILGGGMITSDTYGAGNAGNVAIQAESLLLDGAGHPNSARITSRSGIGAHGNAGVLVVDIADSIVLTNASQISSDSFGTGKAGSIGLRAGSDIRVLTDSTIASNAYAAGNAGTIDIAALNLMVDGTGGRQLTQVSSQAFSDSTGNAGSIRITTPGAVSLINGGKINTSTNSSGSAGDILVATGTLLLDGRDYSGSTGIFSTADLYSSGHGGTLNINVAGDAQILQSARISSGTWSPGDGGNVVFKANNLLIDGMGNQYGAGITSEAAATSSGQGGSVVVDVPGYLQIVDLGFISTATLAQGNAGPVSVTAGRLTIDGKISGLAAIESSSYMGSSGKGGPVSVSVAGDTMIMNGGKISSQTKGGGNAGNIEIQVTGNLHVAGGGVVRSDTQGSGNAGNININANQVLLTRGDIEDFAWILSDSYGSGTAGSVNIQASRSIELAEGGFISSDAYDTGHAGTVSVSAPDIKIGGSGLAWGAAISSDTYATGNAGRVEVSAQTLSIEGGNTSYPTGISSRSHPESSGDAGAVMVNINGALRVLGDGAISSSTLGSGRGGEVLVKGDSIEVSGTYSRIVATASSTSSGQPGNLTAVSKSSLVLSAGGTLSIENYGFNASPSTLLPSMLTVQAAQLILDGGAIKANSTGNIAAGSLQINFSDHLFLKRGSITTSANAGNGGAISIQGGKLIDLNNSEITTSVMGITGNGGNISISSQALAMNTGFIQANTAASNASGGNININVPVLVASGNNLLLGGNTQYSFQTGVFGYNVIQAAAPDGVSGAINIASPVLDISGSLVTLGTPMLDPGGLGRSPCQSTGGSSLGATGWESLPPSARDPLSGEAAAQQFHLSGNVSADRTLPPVRMATLLSRCQ